MAAFCRTCGHACTAECGDDCRRVVGCAVVCACGFAAHLRLGRGGDVGRRVAVGGADSGAAAFGAAAVCGVAIVGCEGRVAASGYQTGLELDVARLVGCGGGADFADDQHTNRVALGGRQCELVVVCRFVDGVSHRHAGCGLGGGAVAAAFCCQCGAEHGALQRLAGLGAALGGGAGATVCRCLAVFQSPAGVQSVPLWRVHSAGCGANRAGGQQLRLGAAGFGGDQNFGSRVLRHPKHQNPRTDCGQRAGVDAVDECGAGSVAGPCGLGLVDCLGGTHQCDMAAGGADAPWLVPSRSGLVALGRAGGGGVLFVGHLFAGVLGRDRLDGFACRKVKANCLSGALYYCVSSSLFWSTLDRWPALALLAAA